MISLTIRLNDREVNHLIGDAKIGNLINIAWGNEDPQFCRINDILKSLMKPGEYKLELEEVRDDE